MKEYSIQFEGLKHGIHTYGFDVDNKFFEEFGCDEFNTAIFKIELRLDKQSTMLILEFNFDGAIDVPCDRCLDEVSITVSGKESIIVKFGSEDYSETDEIIVLSDSEHELNVAKYIYEFINLNTPQKRIHDEGKCNQKVIEKLRKFESKKENIDPRWSTLKDLNLNKK